MQQNIVRALGYVADSVESGYTALFTFGIKEILNPEERSELAQSLRDLSNKLCTADTQSQTFQSKILRNGRNEDEVDTTVQLCESSPTDVSTNLN